ncbi:hypothetical protein ABGB19_07150 [Mycobacterium sp. B14F4]|uniref:hypothetical protein n=1 Tax=Mycobacterium sp. B14F4 TaxID=3153565 RepID=UPI00325F2009
MTSMAALGRRACAALAAASACLHAAMLGHAAGPVAGALLAAMIAACLYCAVDLWRGGTVRAWVVVALMNLAMIGLHLPAPAHHHAPAAASPASALMAAATVLAMVEVAAAAAVLYVRSRGQYARVSDRPDR